MMTPRQVDVTFKRRGRIHADHTGTRGRVSAMIAHIINTTKKDFKMHTRKIKLIAVAAASAIALTATSAYAEAGTNELVDAESSVKLPSVEAAAFYRSRKIERGMVENSESVFGYEAEVEWYGLFIGVEACYDMTDIHNRKGRYNEIASFAGYGAEFGDFSFKAAYLYKKCGGDERNTQEVNLDMEYKTPWVTPYLTWNCDVDKRPWAMYGALGVKRGWEINEWLSVSTYGGVGAGNASRNRLDFDTDRCAFRDMHLGLEVEIEICPHVKLVPGVDIYDQFTQNARHAYRKGFVAVGGVHLVVEF